MRRVHIRCVAFALTLLGGAAQCFAEPINLKCTMQDDKIGQYVSQIAIDPGANYMRVNGSALALNMTDDYYSSAERGSIPGYVVIRYIDRKTGQIKITTMLGSQVRDESKGICDKAPPPAAARF